MDLEIVTLPYITFQEIFFIHTVNLIIRCMMNPQSYSNI